jgi:uncharacterized protein (TIGR03083 family)
MTAEGVAALRADREEVLVLAASLSPDEWAAPSDCEGWRVQDVVAHLANTFRAVVDPGALAPGVPGDLEATQSAQAEAHRSWSYEEVLADYAQISEAGLATLATFQGPPPLDALIPIEDAGMYPLHLVANALAFDHFCHLRNDILQPRGPVSRPAPPADELRVGATLEWLLAGLPQMSTGLADVVTRPVGLELTGPGGGRWAIAPGADGLVHVQAGAAPETLARSAATDFIVWGTGRQPWREMPVELVGDGEYAAAVLDAIRLF